MRGEPLGQEAVTTARVTSQLELGWDRDWVRARLGAQAQVDARIDALSYLLLEEGWLQLRNDDLRLYLGSRIVNWSVSELFRPLDSVNSRDWNSALTARGKIGELMVELWCWLFAGGLLTLHYMPLRTPPRFPAFASSQDVIGLPLGEARWIEADGSLSDSRWAHQFGARWSQTLGEADVAFHFLHHFDRQHPVFVQGPEGALRPALGRLAQVGASAQYVLDAVVLRVEGAHRQFLAASSEVPRQRDHAVVAGGGEVTLLQAERHEGLLTLEVQGVLGVDADARRRLTPFQRDLGVAYRHRFHEARAPALSLALFLDLEDARELSVQASYSQLWLEDWSLLTLARYVSAPGSGGLHALDDSVLLSTSLTRSF